MIFCPVLWNAGAQHAATIQRAGGNPSSQNKRIHISACYRIKIQSDWFLVWLSRLTYTSADACFISMDIIRGHFQQVCYRFPACLDPLVLSLFKNMTSYSFSYQEMIGYINFKFSALRFGSLFALIITESGRFGQPLSQFFWMSCSTS